MTSLLPQLCMVLSVICIIMPVSMLSSLGNLSYVSLLSILSIFYMVGLMFVVAVDVGECVEKWSVINHNINIPPLYHITPPCCTPLCRVFSTSSTSGGGGQLIEKAAPFSFSIASVNTITIFIAGWFCCCCLYLYCMPFFCYFAVVSNYTNSDQLN